jgi:hypothetical protein
VQEIWDREETAQERGKLAAKIEAANKALVRAGADSDLNGSTMKFKLKEATTMNPLKLAKVGVMAGGAITSGVVAGGIGIAKGTLEGSRNDHVDEDACGDEGAGDLGPGEVNADAQPALVKKEMNPPRPGVYTLLVHVLEARDLYSPEDEVANAVMKCTLNLKGEMMSTKIKMHSNAPFWDETLSFEVIFDQDSDISSAHIDMACYSTGSTNDRLIGCFQIDLGRMVWEQKNHELHLRWIGLVHPESQDAGIRGYAKVSVSILGHGMKPNGKYIAHKNVGDQVINPLLPGTVAMETGELLAYIYRAEDLPQMDADISIGRLVGKSKTGSLCDAYIECYYSDVIVSDPVSTAIKEKDQNPEFNECVRIPIQRPRLAAKDKSASYGVARWAGVRLNNCRQGTA